ncbi:secondary thiamine-phosphate synthase enzyme YjbQ [Candidatus Omnitrophota bacterium]
MTVITNHIELSTRGNAEIVDITPDIEQALDTSGLSDGVLTVFVSGATGGLTTIEYEPGLVRDLNELWDRIIPSNKTYHHDRAWGDGNGHSHVRASLLGPSLTIPFCSGTLTLGTWQQVIFIDFDVRPRTRRIVLQFMGERKDV